MFHSEDQFKWINLSNPATAKKKYWNQPLKQMQDHCCNNPPLQDHQLHSVPHFKINHPKTHHYRTICHTTFPPSQDHLTTFNIHDIVATKKAFPFDHVGNMPATYTIRIYPSIPPVQHSRHKVPIEYKEAIEKTLQNMVGLKTITPVTEPTQWVSALTYPCKPDGTLHICLDQRDLNKAIIREHYKASTLEEISHTLPGATLFSRLDA